MNDRHCDPDIQVFSTPSAAIACAREFMAVACAHPEEIADETADGYVLWLQYQVESDHAFVVEREVHQPMPPPVSLMMGDITIPLPEGYKAGDTVRITVGPFSDVRALVVEREADGK